MSKILSKLLAIIIVFQLTTVSSLQQSFAAPEEPRLRVMDTTAGIPAMIIATGEPEEVIKLTIVNPYKSVITQPFKLNELGVLQYWYPQAVIAGEYKVIYKDKETLFAVYPGLPDPQRSVLELSDYTTYVGGAIEGTLVLKDHYGNLITGREIDLQSKGLAQVNCLNNCRSNHNGFIRFSINSQKAGLKKLTVLDAENGLKVFQEDLGFIPHVQRPAQQFAYPYLGYNAPSPSYMNPVMPSSFAYQNPFESNFGAELPYQFDYLPVYDPTRASFSAQGNNDQLLGDFFDPSFSTLLGANILDAEPQLIVQADTGLSPPVIAQNTNKVQKLEIIIGDDPEADFEEEVTVSAQTALDLTVRAVNSLGEVVEDYTGEIEFELSTGGLVPNDYRFSEIDKGSVDFELALVLEVGAFELTVQDKNDPSILGELNITSQFEGIPNLNNTNIQLTVESPIANSMYSKNFSVKGATSTDNTEIIISEGPLELKRAEVDENKEFNMILDLSDGNHTLEISAIYLPDGSETKTTIPLEVDKTAPVITQVNVDETPVRTGEPFTITAVADEKSKLQVFINNRSYDLIDEKEGNYSMTANAPLDPGSYPVHARAADELGNVTDSPNVGTLNVVPGLQEISNLFGIPGIGTMTISWNPVEGATNYEVTYRSILGQSQQKLSATEARITVQDLAPNLSYIFTVVAQDALGNEVSKPTKTKALKVLEAPRQAAGSTFVETPTTPVVGAEPVRDVETKPVRHTKSGPEVYVLIFLSLIVLNFYGRIRKAFAQTD